MRNVRICQTRVVRGWENQNAAAADHQVLGLPINIQARRRQGASSPPGRISRGGCLAAERAGPTCPAPPSLQPSWPPSPAVPWRHAPCAAAVAEGRGWMSRRARQLGERASTCGRPASMPRAVHAPSSGDQETRREGREIIHESRPGPRRTCSGVRPSGLSLLATPAFSLRFIARMRSISRWLPRVCGGEAGGLRRS